jgi:DNA-binding transcriptional MerR regulator
VSVDTVRYYERRKLLPRAPRSQGGSRLFLPETVERVLFIKHAQEMGLSLEEITQLLATHGGAAECQKLRDLLCGKLVELDERMKKMRAFGSSRTARRCMTLQKSTCRRESTGNGFRSSWLAYARRGCFSRGSQTASSSRGPFMSHSYQGMSEVVN